MPLDPELEPHLIEASRLENLDPNLLRALLAGESSYRPGATSPAGAGGIAQIMPGTAKQYGIDDPYDPVQGIYGGAKILNDALRNAEQIRASGRDINPTDYALRTYFAGQEGPGWGAKTAAYPGYIYSRYRQLAGDSQPTAATAQPTDVDGPAPAIPKSAPGQYLSVPPAAAPAAPEGDVALRQQYDAALARYPQTEGQYGEGYYNSEQGKGRRPKPESFEQYKSRFGPGMNGLDQLAAAGQPQPPAQGAADTGVMQLAQAGAPNDAQIWQGFIKGDYDHLFQPKPAQPPAQATPTAAPSSQPAALPPSPGAPIVPYADPANSMYSPALRQQLTTFDDGRALLKQIIDNEKEGIQQNRDGTQSIIKGGSKDPMVQFQGKRSEALGTGLNTVDQNGVVQNSPGVSEAAAGKAGATSEAQEGPKRITEAVKPQDTAPGKGVLYPPGSPNAGIAASGNQPGGGLTASPAPGGGTVITGTPANEETAKFNDRLTELGKQADEARKGVYAADLLRQRLHEIGTSGPLTETLGSLSALGQQLGVPADTLKKFGLPNGATVEQANAVALGLLGEVLKAQFPNRITNTDIAVFKPSAANVNMLQEADDFLLDKKVVPSLKQDIGRYSAVVGQDFPQKTPLQIERYLDKWHNDHPIGSFVEQPNKRLHYNPKTQQLEPAAQ